MRRYDVIRSWQCWSARRNRRERRAGASRIVTCTRDLEDFLIEAFIALHPTPPEVIELDLDATDDPLHGHQLGLFADGTSCASLRANQLRLWFSTLAYLVLAVLREWRSPQSLAWDVNMS